jgi:hypothetical protein
MKGNAFVDVNVDRRQVITKVIIGDRRILPNLAVDLYERTEERQKLGDRALVICVTR